MLETLSYKNLAWHEELLTLVKTGDITRLMLSWVEWHWWKIWAYQP